MPVANFSVYVRIYNNTKYKMKLKKTSTNFGTWERVPSTIDANTTSTEFQLTDPSGPAGAEGRFEYDVEIEDEAMRTVSTYQTDPYAAGVNTVTHDTTSPAPFTVTYRAKVEGRDWTENRVEATGHPFTVHYALDPN